MDEILMRCMSCGYSYTQNIDESTQDPCPMCFASGAFRPEQALAALLKASIERVEAKKAGITKADKALLRGMKIKW